MEINRIKPRITFIEIFDIILTGSKEDSRKAAREVRKFLYSSRSGGREKYDEIKLIINNAPERYAAIKEDWREVNFAVAISVLYYLHDKEKQPDFLFPWLFSLLLHKNGNVRQSAVRMIENEIGPLTVHIRFPDERYNDRIMPEQADLILLNLFMKLSNLLDDLWKPSYKKYKYVSSLPTSPYKSINMVLARMMEDCGESYMYQLERLIAQARNSNRIH